MLLILPYTQKIRLNVLEEEEDTGQAFIPPLGGFLFVYVFTANVNF